MHIVFVSIIVPFRGYIRIYEILVFLNLRLSTKHPGFKNQHRAPYIAVGVLADIDMGKTNNLIDGHRIVSKSHRMVIIIAISIQVALRRIFTRLIIRFPPRIQVQRLSIIGRTGQIHFAGTFYRIAGFNIRPAKGTSHHRRSISRQVQIIPSRHRNIAGIAITAAFKPACNVNFISYSYLIYRLRIRMTMRAISIGRYRTDNRAGSRSLIDLCTSHLGTG